MREVLSELQRRLQESAVVSRIARYSTSFVLGVGLATGAFAQETVSTDGQTRLAHILERLVAAQNRLSNAILEDSTRLSPMNELRGAMAGSEGKRLLEGASHPLMVVRVGHGAIVEYLSLTRILSGSWLSPVRTEQHAGRLTDVFSFTRMDASPREKSLQGRMAQALEGSIWVDRDSDAVVRMDFRSRVPLRLAGGWFGKVTSIRGYIDFQRLPDDLWVPRHEEAIVEGHEVIVSVIALRVSKSYQLSEISDFTVYSPSAGEEGGEPSTIGKPEGIAED